MTPTTICNLALDEVPAGRLVSLDEQSLQAKTCRLWYPQILAELLEVADWGFARSRIRLARTTNDRQDEWSAAFQLPTGVAFPLGLYDGKGKARNMGVNYVHHSWTANAQTTKQLDENAMRRLPFAIFGDKVYTYSQDVVLEYVADTIFVERAYALFRKALILKLAAAVSMPITKDPARKAALLQEAEIAEQRAIAANFNREPQTYGDFIPEVVAFQTGMSRTPQVVGTEFTMLEPPANRENIPTNPGNPAPPPPPPITSDPGQPTTPTGQVINFPDWSDLFEDQLNFPV